MTFEQAEKCPFNPFDLTKVCAYMHGVRMHEIFVHNPFVVFSTIILK